MNLIISMQVLYLRYCLIFLAIYQGWPEKVLCVEGMQHLLTALWYDIVAQNNNLNCLLSVLFRWGGEGCWERRYCTCS